VHKYIAKWAYTHGNLLVYYSVICIYISKFIRWCFPVQNTNFHVLLAAIAFNALDNDEFKQMCEAIGQFGPGMVCSWMGGC